MLSCGSGSSSLAARWRLATDALLGEPWHDRVLGGTSVASPASNGTMTGSRSSRASSSFLRRLKFAPAPTKG